MRIAWLAKHMWPETVGGVECVVENVCRYMRSWGHDVQLYVSARPRGFFDRLGDGRSVIGLAGGSVPGPFWRVGPLWRACQSVSALPGGCQVDVIFTPDPVLGVAHLLGGSQVPLVYCPGGTVTGSFRWHWPSDGAGNWVRRIQRPFLPSRQYVLAERLCLLRSSGLVAVSLLVKRQMLRVHAGCGHRIRVIHNGYNVPGDDGYFAGAGVRQAVSSLEPFTVICVARLHRIKNIAFLIKAWSLVRCKSKRLMLVGDGEELGALKALASELGLDDSVIFLGERLDVPHLLRGADLFVLPSFYEACGLAVIEAMGAGLPCITLKNVEGITAVAASGEINIDGLTGFCVDPQDPAVLAGKIDLLAADASLRGEMGRAARRRVSGRFTWERVARAYVRLAEELVSRAGR